MFDAELLISSQRAHALVNDWTTGFFFGFASTFTMYRCELKRLLCIGAPLSFRGAEGSTGASHTLISDR